MTTRWDIFCTVVDNYGDIGVTWRLARQLVAEQQACVHLWVDDLGSFQRLCPTVQPELTEQTVAGVLVHAWTAETVAGAEPGQVVIEAFGCQLPDLWVERMRGVSPAPLWLNLEYLSAEAWVEGCHGLPSPQPGGLKKSFFFPGFTAATGGLLREAGLVERCAAFQADDEAQVAFLQQLGVQRQLGQRLISLFAYENAGLAGWLDALAGDAQPSLLLVPQGRIEADLRRWLGGEVLAPGQCWQRGALTIQLLSFLTQEDYDRLLWCCDLNAIRGEDSFLRAQWAGRPFLWHIYQQEEGAHWVKLEAFLDLYLADLAPEAAAALRQWWQAWNAAEAVGTAWLALQPHWPALAEHARRWRAAQAAYPDLATKLAQFYRNWLSYAA